MSSSSGSGQSLRCIVVTQILHLVGSHEVVVHATLEIALAQHATLVVVHSTVGAQAAQVRLHDVLALGIVVERKRAALGSAEAPSAGTQEQRASRLMSVRCGFCDDLTSAGSAECRHVAVLSVVLNKSRKVTIFGLDPAAESATPGRRQGAHPDKLFWSSSTNCACYRCLLVSIL
jgi:hypothetical protein